MNITEREAEILRMLYEGMTSNEIAGLLNISKRTVNFHISNLVVKLGARNRMHALVIAIANHLIEL